MNIKPVLKIALPLVAGIAGGIFLSGCSVFGARDTPEPDYKVVQTVKDQEDVEIREYKPMIVATTQVEATSYKEASGKAFRRLADYIFGANIKDEEIGMTAPVYQNPKSRDGENIGMTAPVFQNAPQGNQWEMSFVMPERYTMETLPKPKDNSINIEEVPSKKVAVIRFSGKLDDELMAKKTKELQSWISTSNWEAASAPRSAGYDPPFTIPAFRRNEVLIEVKPK